MKIISNLKISDKLMHEVNRKIELAGLDVMTEINGYMVRAAFINSHKEYHYEIKKETKKEVKA